MFNQHSVHGIIHGLFGAVVFSLAPASCLVLYRRLRRDPAWRGLAPWTLVVGVTLIVEIVLLKVAEQPTSALFAWKGLVQRVILISFFGWLFTVAARPRHIAAWKVSRRAADTRERSPIAVRLKRHGGPVEDRSRAPPPKSLGVTHWSSGWERLGVSHVTIAQAWKDFGVKPWQAETFKFSTDPSSRRR